MSIVLCTIQWQKCFLFCSILFYSIKFNSVFLSTAQLQSQFNCFFFVWCPGVLASSVVWNITRMRSLKLAQSNKASICAYYGPGAPKTTTTEWTRALVCACQNQQHFSPKAASSSPEVHDLSDLAAGNLNLKDWEWTGKDSHKNDL